MPRKRLGAGFGPTGFDGAAAFEPPQAASSSAISRSGTARTEPTVAAACRLQAGRRGDKRPMAESGKLRRAVELTLAARRAHLLRVLRELGVAGSKDATREGAVRLREGLEDLGTTFVKLGQLLSSRPDLLPDVYLEELGKLVDDVPALPYEPIRDVIAAEIGLEEFASIDPVPLASASIAQIHTALLANGREVVVKVRRPGIEDQVDV